MNWETFERQLFRNPAFRKVADRSEPEYQRARRRIAGQIAKRGKTYLYVDGTNVFIGLSELFGIKKLPAFSAVLDEINKLFKIDRIYFYASYTPFFNNKYKKYKHTAIVESKFYKDVRGVRYLTFFTGHRSPTSGKEKGVDVHLAVDIVRDCLQNKYSRVVLMSGDADLSYPLEIAKGFGKKTHAVFLPNRFSLGISHRASSSFILNYRDRFRSLRKDLPRSLKILKIKDPACKHTG